MKAQLVGTALGCLVLSLMAAGCGGGGGAPPSVAPSDTTHMFRIDFETDTVTVIEEPVVGSEMVDANPGGASPEMALSLTVLESEPGLPGRRHVAAVVTNNSSGDIGVGPDGVVSGVDLVITGLRFETGGGTPIPGGGMAGYHSYNALTSLPVYRIPEAVGVGEVSSSARLSFVLPRTATTAVVGIIVRADTAYYNAVENGGVYLTTIAGDPDDSGLVNGPYGAARFQDPYGLHVRESAGDVLVADLNNSVVRRLRDGVVSTHIAGFGMGMPIDVDEDAAGNIVVSGHVGNRIYLAPPGGGAPTAIAGTGVAGDLDGTGDLARIDNPWGIAVLGDRIYFADEGNDKVKVARYMGAGSRSVGANYNVYTVLTGMGGVTALAFDHLGNMFIAQAATYQILLKPSDDPNTYVIAGSGASGGKNGLGTVAEFGDVQALHCDQIGTLYAAEDNRKIRRIRYTGGDKTQPVSYRVDTLIDHAAAAHDGASAAACCDPAGIHVASDGSVWFTDEDAIRRADRLVN